MSFKTKIDFCGLADGTTIKLKAHDEGRGQGLTTCENDEGDTVDVTKFGQLLDPSNEYELAADAANLEIVLGGVNTVEINGTSRNFVLKSVTVGTSNSGKVSISAQAEEVASATPKRTYTVTIAALKARVKAQILNSLFSLGGEDVHLQNANYTFSVETEHTTIDGERVMTDVYGGKIVCALTAKQAGAVAPTVAAGADDTNVTIITGDPNENRPDSDYSQVAAEVTKYLLADEPAAATTQPDAATTQPAAATTQPDANNG